MIQYKDILLKHSVVEASAGTGKTYTIVEIVKEALLQKVPIEKLAIITFTEKAASELHAKIWNALNANEKDLNKANILLEAKKKFQFATIGTIHHLCRKILSAHSYFSGISPDFTEIHSEKEILKKIFSLYYGKLSADKSKDIRDLIQQLGFLSFRDFLFESYFSLYGKKIGISEPKENELKNDFETFRKNQPTFTEKDKAKYHESLREIYSISTLEEFVQNSELFFQTFFTQENEIRSNPKKFILKTSQISENEYDQLICKIYRNLQYRKSYPALKLLSEISNEFNERVGDYYRLNDLTTTGILTIQVRDLICKNQEVLKQVREKYQYIIIDEFQDTSPIQADLFKLIFEDNHQGLVFVGDPKQSIYRFLRADLDSYEDLTKNRKKYTLDETRRSSFQLTDGLNGIFLKLLDQYTEVKAHREKFEYQSQTAPLIYLGLDNNNFPILDSFEKDKQQSVASREISALRISEVIRYLIDNEVCILDPATNQSRIINYSDIAVLSSSKNRFYFLENEFSMNGIPASIYKNDRFYESDLIQAISFLVHSIENPEDSLSLFKTLKSDLFQISDDVLFQLSRDSEVSYLRGSSGPVQKIFESFKRLYEKRYNQTVSKTILDALGDFNILSKVSLGFNGNRNVADIYHLCEIADKMQIEDGMSFGAVARKLKSNVEENIEEKKKLNSDKFANEECVSVMTIHASKGLEFPVVILYDLTTNFVRNSKSVMIFPNDSSQTKETSLSEIFVRTENGELRTPGFEEKKKIEIEKDHEEEKRLLYVAMTRARDFLILPLNLSPTKKSDRPRSQREILEKVFDQSFIQDTIDKNLAVNFANLPKNQNQKIHEKKEPHENSKDLSMLAFSPFEIGGNFKLEIDSFTSISRKMQKEKPRKELVESEKSEDESSKNYHTDSGLKFGSICHSVLESFPLESFQKEDRIEKNLRNLIREIYPKEEFLGLAGYGEDDLFQICYSALTKSQKISSNPELYAKLSEWEYFKREKPFYNYLGRENSKDRFFYGIGDGMFLYKSKYYLLDWKTNRLDNYSWDTLKSYVEEHYFFQYHIYCLNFLNNIKYFSTDDKNHFWDHQFGGMIFIFLREHRDKEGNFIVKPTIQELENFENEYLLGNKHG